ncbi:MAG: PIG-L family deacetylase, partial [Rhodothermaceae bacterium]|nr:PIG-L family deacetylase [Rhodothermaceae bacterium]
MHRLLLSAVLLFPLVACAQGEGPPPASDVDEVRPLVVMNLAAHPDDEDGLTLTYYRHNQNAVAYSVIYTRGEGGQNEAGAELYERLGAIRTEETERAARILGTQVYFLNFYDFGYSKHAREAFAEWSRPRVGFWDTDDPIVSAEAGREIVTERLVRLIRTLKPNVLFTNHDTSTAWPRAQHGQHQAVGISAYDAFALAADPAYHPEQLEEDGVDLWQPQRLFLRRFSSDGTHDVAVPVGDPCNDQGVPCADLGVQAAAQHVSQGFDKFAPRFRRDTSYFRLYREAPNAPPLPAGTNDLAAGLAPNPHIGAIAASYLLDSGRRTPMLEVQTNPGVAVPGQAVTLRWTPPATPSEGTVYV